MPAPSPQHWPSLPPAGDAEAVLRWVRTLTADQLAFLKPEFDDDVITAKRRSERDTLVAAFAVTLANGDRGQARQAFQLLRRYADSAWRFDQNMEKPHNLKNLPLYKIMRASGGKVISESTLRRIIGLSKVAHRRPLR